MFTRKENAKRTYGEDRQKNMRTLQRREVRAQTRPCKSRRITQTHTFDGADHLVQVFEVVAVGPAARADLQRVVWSVLCKKLAHKAAI